MKMFISWSGPRSQEMAEFLKSWLSNTFQSLEIFFSGDIQKGKGWHSSILSELESCDMGIFLLTRKNIEAKWLYYEAGAITKRFSHSNAFTLLIDNGLEPDSLGPLSHFQATKMNEKDILKLLHSINDCLGDRKLDDRRLGDTLSKWLPEFWKMWDIIKNIRLDLPYEENLSKEEIIDDIRGRVVAINSNFVNVIEKLNEFADLFNSRLGENINKIDKVYSRYERERGKLVCSPVTLPDGSVIINSKFAKGAVFKTWEGYGIASGKSSVEIEELKRRDLDNKHPTKEDD